MSVFIAMNRFVVNPERSEDFEKIWRERETHLEAVPGFIRFALLKGDEPGQYVSHSTWESREAFEGWTHSESFRKAHARARTPEGIMAGHPKLETFEAILES